MPEEKKLTAVVIPPITQEFYDRLMKAFPNRPIKDDMTMMQIGRAAGQQQVLDWIRQFVGAKKLTGNPDAIRKPTVNPILSLLRKLT